MDKTEGTVLDSVTAAVAMDVLIDYEDKCIGRNELGYMMLLGLAEEAGEVAGIGKRLIRNNPSDREKTSVSNMTDELGDVLWYLAGVCHAYNISLEDVWQTNRRKLEERYGHS